ncbi:MAG: aldose 1-epimerase [Pseudomonadota bacterium]|nr:aldose 1-epimerase [Pseudomonadota bacterium]
MATELDLVTLSAGPLKLALCPSIGGSIARFEYSDGQRSVPILRGCKTPTDVLGMDSFPLVPYVNRIRGGEFTFRGETVRLTPNMTGDPSPLHGQGWLNPWRVIAASEGEAILEYQHEAGEWPWSYRAEQRFELDESSLEITLACRNLSSGPMPCGLGQHPYFHCSPKSRIQTHVEHVWTIDEHVLPIEKIDATDRYDLSDRPVCGLGLDHGFGGWGGTARLSDPDWPFDITMSSPDAAFFQLYSPDSGELFVAEPVSHANAALNAPEGQWPELGMRVLQCDEEMTLSMRLAIS